MTNGPSFVTDTIYPARFKHVDELQRMGANIYADEGTATIKPSRLEGTEVYASDLRAGACLITAGLIAEGVTTIFNVKHIYRGYTNIVEHLKSLEQIFGLKKFKVLWYNIYINNWKTIEKCLQL